MWEFCNNQVLLVAASYTVTWAAYPQKISVNQQSYCLSLIVVGWMRGILETRKYKPLGHQGSLFWLNTHIWARCFAGPRTLFRNIPEAFILTKLLVERFYLRNNTQERKACIKNLTFSTWNTYFDTHPFCSSI